MYRGSSGKDGYLKSKFLLKNSVSYSKFVSARTEGQPNLGRCGQGGGGSKITENVQTSTHAFYNSVWFLIYNDCYGICTNNQQKYRLPFDKTSLTLANFLLTRQLIPLGIICFRQLIWVSLGFDPSPFLVNLALCYYKETEIL